MQKPILSQLAVLASLMMFQAAPASSAGTKHLNQKTAPHRAPTFQQISQAKRAFIRGLESQLPSIKQINDATKAEGDIPVSDAMCAIFDRDVPPESRQPGATVLAGAVIGETIIETLNIVNPKGLRALLARTAALTTAALEERDKISDETMAEVIAKNHNNVQAGIDFSNGRGAEYAFERTQLEDLYYASRRTRVVIASIGYQAVANICEPRLAAKATADGILPESETIPAPTLPVAPDQAGLPNLQPN